MPTAPASPLVAVDANVLMDLGQESESVIDALATIRRRLPSPRIVIPPTAKLELVHIARKGDTARDRKRASDGIVAARRWGVIPVNLMPVGHGIVERVAEKLRSADLIPASEVNDSQLVAEAAFIGARLLMSSDAHLRGVDFERLTIELRNFDLAAPVIATPAEGSGSFSRGDVDVIVTPPTRPADPARTKPPNGRQFHPPRESPCGAGLAPFSTRSCR